MRGLLHDLRKFGVIVKERGVWWASKFVLFVIRVRLMRRSDRRWESRWRISTQDNLQLDALDVTSQNKQYGFSYSPSPARPVRVLLSNIPEDLSNFTFVDFGSGEGWVLLIAATFPFREVIGVEFARQLHETALRNVVSATRSLESANKIQPLHLDAVQYELPRNACVLYFHNPFNKQVFEQVLHNIERSHRDYGMKLYVLFQQTGKDLEDAKTENVALLRATTFLRERYLRFPTLYDRFLLGSHDLFIFETAD